MNRIFLPLAILLIASCGGTPHGSRHDDAGSGTIRAEILNSKSFNPNISHGKILQYKVIIEGDGITEPVTALFDGEADSGLIENVPAGEERTIRVEAINPNKVKIREGEAGGIIVEPGGMTEAKVKMESVPVFANLADGNSIPNTRFTAKIFSEPAVSVAVEDEFGGRILPLFDISTNAGEIVPDASTGIAVVAPPLLQAGGHKFTVRNLKTGRSTTVVVNITDGEKIKAAPIFSGGRAAPLQRLGQAVFKTLKRSDL